jgi:hypothetical protein
MAMGCMDQPVRSPPFNLFLFPTCCVYNTLMSFRIWNGLSFLGIAFTYFPVSQLRFRTSERKQLLQRIDYLGGLLSITGLTLL